MKSTKLIISISELWNEKQLASVNNCLLRGIEEINKKVLIGDLIEFLKTKESKSDLFDVDVLVNVKKVDLLDAIKAGSRYESMIVLYVGPVTVPWGHWLLCDGILSSVDVIHAKTNELCKMIIATLNPCDDWLAAEKKHSDFLNVYSYGMDNCSDVTVLGLSDYVDSICGKLSITPCSIKRPDALSFLKATEPSACVFLDRNCSAMPCLFLIDGFTMLFNVGYGRNPVMRQQLKYIAQIDAVLLSHLSCNNILALSGSAQDSEAVKINHLFLPHGVSVSEKVAADNDQPFTVDLNNELAKVLSGYGARGTSVSTLSIKGKTGLPVTPVQVKPIQLYHKIGYGSLELVPLAPFEDDPDMKKYVEDLKKSKYINEAQTRSLPSSLSVLLIWRPFNDKVPVKRFLYIGPRSQLRKTLPGLVTTLFSTVHCLRHADNLAGDTAAKKLPGAKKGPMTTTKINGTVPPAEKPSRPATASEAIKKHPTTGSSALATDKPPRPSTATVTSATQKSKDAPTAKRPIMRPKTEDVKRTEPTTLKKHSESPRPLDSKKAEPSKVHDVKKSDSAKAAVPKKPETSHEHDAKKPGSKIAGKIDSKPMAKKGATKVEHKVEDHHGDSAAVINGDGAHSNAVTINHVIHDGDVLPDGGRPVAVGTVECAITEHGEADFCDETPEEFSADQMKHMGLYDDDDRSSAQASEKNDIDHLVSAGEVGQGHQDVSLDNDVVGGGQTWNQPLGMPLPVKDSTAATTATKKPLKCATPIHVDCVCVPSDLDLEDLRCLFSCVRFQTGFVQLEKSEDLFHVLELLMEEWGNEGKDVATVLPSLDDEASLAWTEANAGRLSAAKVRVAAGLSRCSIVIGGERGDDACLGYRCDL